MSPSNLHLLKFLSAILCTFLVTDFLGRWPTPIPYKMPHVLIGQEYFRHCSRHLDVSCQEEMMSGRPATGDAV